MLGIAFLITYFLSFDAMVVSIVPGIIAFVGSSAGIFICACRLAKESKKK